MSNEVVWNLPPLRVDAYRSSDLSQIEFSVTSFLSQLLYRISWYQISTSLPVLRGVKSYRFFSLFLGLLLNIIVLFIFGLSVLLIYSLLMVSVDSRTFELGILRMVGMTRRRLVGLVLTQAMAYALPAIALGLPIAQGLAVLAVNFLSDLANVELSVLLTPLSICLAILAGKEKQNFIFF
jgi:ABC-type antimicrobial peptide transport system permease subunit